ncbi:hypothetical protein HBM99_13880 [Providencia heimbachae]|uniref:hypothetical protein n=1 Tax=Providencia heimbachae TaxID=333962 RepID=UPI001419909E|nr:hypothetical protein [Providencia heimbachae]NIH23430.1 hypothetical protein [Providencia heimbachae]
MHTNQKYNRAMRDGFMVKPSKPQATRASRISKRKTADDEPSWKLYFAVIVVMFFVALPLFAR